MKIEKIVLNGVEYVVEIEEKEELVDDLTSEDFDNTTDLSEIVEEALSKTMELESQNGQK